MTDPTPSPPARRHHPEAHRLPEIPAELARQIKLLRRDMGSLLFHFTRGTGQPLVRERNGIRVETDGTAREVLKCILTDGALKGTSRYIRSGEPCVCFTEAPLQEFATLFRLNEIAASRNERPRYEPYGVAVNKDWLFAQGGRPVIYDHPDAFEQLPGHLKHRLVPYDPAAGLDHSWEREWRIKTASLALHPSRTLAVVPTADEAAEIVYAFSEWEPDTEYTIGGPMPRWLAVSLDIFGFDDLS